MSAGRNKVNIYLLTLSINLLFTTNLFAALSEMKDIKKMEKAEDEGNSHNIKRPDFIYDAQNLRDPFKGSPLIQKKEEKEAVEVVVEQKEETPLPSLTVQGLIWGGEFPQAIINGKVVKVGDLIEGAKVTGIDKNGVTLDFENRKMDLSSPGIGSAKKNEP